MICRHIRFPYPDNPGMEWVPMGLRDGVCLLRRSNPEKWAAILRDMGVEVEEGDFFCLHNHDASWEHCVLFAARVPGGRRASDVPRNEFGYPLVL